MTPENPERPTDGRKVWHRKFERWYTIVEYYPEDKEYYALVQDDKNGDQFAITRESVYFDLMRESIAQELAGKYPSV